MNEHVAVKPATAIRRPGSRIDVLPCALCGGTLEYYAGELAEDGEWYCPDCLSFGPANQESGDQESANARV